MLLELESPPDTAWRRVVKTLIIKLVTHGVYGRWDEMPLFKDHTLVNEFLVQWIF